MAGKSAHMRQAAILMIMAGMVPLSLLVKHLSHLWIVFLHVSVLATIFLLVKSTFMVEMKEVAYILENATHNSLVILDEVVGVRVPLMVLSIAQAVVEHVVSIFIARLYLQHYHELIC